MLSLDGPETGGSRRTTLPWQYFSITITRCFHRLLIIDDSGSHLCWPYSEPVLAFAIQPLNDKGLIPKIKNLLDDQRYE
jgi:hypothetical protein